MLWRKKVRDAPLGYSWFQAAVLEAANSDWLLTSAGSLHWSWGEPNSDWLLTSAGSLGQPCGDAEF